MDIKTQKYFKNWSDTASWSTDGSLQYDERNNVLYFDKTKVTEKLSDVNEDYDVAAVRTFDIPGAVTGFISRSRSETAHRFSITTADV